MSRKSRVVFKSSHFWWLYSYTSIRMCVRLEKSKSTNEFIYDQACHRQPSNKTSIVCNSLPQWNLSFGTPLFKGQKIWSQKNVLHNLCICYIYRRDTSILGKRTLFVGRETPRGGGGYSTNVYGRRLRPTSNPSPLLLYTIFHEKDTNFVYLLLTNGTPFVFKCCQCTVLKIGINNKNSMFSKLHRVLKFIYQPINLGPFTDPNEIFPSPFIYFNQ